MVLLSANTFGFSKMYDNLMIQKRKQGVSAVIGVILMITLAIILAATVSQFAFEIENILQQPVNAGLNFNEDYDAAADNYDVTIVWSGQGNVETLYAIQPDNSQTPAISQVGADVTVQDVDAGETIRVIGVLDDGTRGVVREYSVAS